LHEQLSSSESMSACCRSRSARTVASELLDMLGQYASEKHYGDARGTPIVWTR